MMMKRRTTPNILPAASRKLFPVWPKLYGHNFFVSRKKLEVEVQKPENKDISLAAKGGLFATPLSYAWW